MVDLNSVPASPRVAARSGSNMSTSNTMSPPLSRRTSSTMGPPPVPQNSSVPSSPHFAQAMPVDNYGVGMGPGPIRHPRPLTAAELHLELEKEQEGIVNRLTRELTQLRAQTASVASTASTSSELFTTDPATSYPYPPFTTSSSIIPTSARRHRSSSNLSTRSARSIRDAAQNATSVSGVAAPREQSVSMQSSSRPSSEVVRPDMSRQNSITTSGQRAPSVPASPYIGHANRHTGSTPTSASVGPAPVDGAGVMGPGHPRSPSITATVAAARYEEAVFHRAELEAVKKENDMLRQRIRELERRVSRRSSTEQGGVSVAEDVQS